MRTSSNVIGGRVNSDATIVIAGPFAVRKNATGNYAITFAPPFRLRGVAFAGLAGGATAHPQAQNDREVTVQFIISGASGDSGFDFTATGV